MLASTALATLATGEHYFIDLVAGFAFGCFAASVGHKRVVPAVLYLGAAIGWSAAIRFQFQFLIHNPGALRLLAALTILAGLAAIAREWTSPARDYPANVVEDLSAV